MSICGSLYQFLYHLHLLKMYHKSEFFTKKKKNNKTQIKNNSRISKLNYDFSSIFSTNSQAIPRIPILPMIPVYCVPVPQVNDSTILSPVREKLSSSQPMQPPQQNPYSMYLF